MTLLSSLQTIDGISLTIYLTNSAAYNAAIEAAVAAAMTGCTQYDVTVTYVEAARRLLTLAAQGGALRVQSNATDDTAYYATDDTPYNANDDTAHNATDDSPPSSSSSILVHYKVSVSSESASYSTMSEQLENAVKNGESYCLFV